jgi:hypothetical protein
MAETPEKSTELPLGELREITLRIPGEHFFCDSISLPSSLDAGKFGEFAEFTLNEGGLSPYPADQLAWGYQADEELGKNFYFCSSPGEASSGWLAKL